MTMNQFEIIDSVCRSLSKKFEFPGYDSDDIYQESYIICVEDIMPKYDGTSPLENFLKVSLANRLLNFRRKNIPSYKFVCSECKNKDSDNCDVCIKNRVNHSVKKNLYSPINIEEAQDDALQYEHVEKDWENAEIFTLINLHLPTQMREDYLKMMSDVYINKNRREEIISRIRDILLQNDFMDG